MTNVSGAQLESELPPVDPIAPEESKKIVGRSPWQIARSRLRRDRAICHGERPTIFLDSSGAIGSTGGSSDSSCAPLTFVIPVSYTHLRAHETRHDLVCRLLLEK